MSALRHTLIALLISLVIVEDSEAAPPINRPDSGSTLRMTAVETPPIPVRPPEIGNIGDVREPADAPMPGPGSELTQPACEEVQPSCAPVRSGCSFESNCAAPLDFTTRLPALGPQCAHDIEWRPYSRPRVADSCGNTYTDQAQDSRMLDPCTMSFADGQRLAQSFFRYVWDNSIPEGQIGFAFFAPFVSNPGTITIPTAGTPFAATTPNVFRDVTYAPTFNVNTTIGAGPKIGASGTGFSLIGNRTDTLTAAGATATLTQNGTITTVIANIPEVTLPPYCPKWACLGSQPWLITIGMRYTTVSQDYHYTLTMPTEVRDFRSTQGYWGYGATVKVEHEWLIPNRPQWAIYGKARGSFTQGQNHRNSTFIVTPTAGAATNTLADQVRSLIMTVGEFETGLRFNRSSAKYQSDQIEWLRLGAILQIYGNAGPLSATAANVATFPTGNLYLLGGQVTVVFK